MTKNTFQKTQYDVDLAIGDLYPHVLELPPEIQKDLSVTMVSEIEKIYLWRGKKPYKLTIDVEKE